MDIQVVPFDASGMWHERLKKKAGSDRKAAERLFPEWKKKARREVERVRTTPTALANKIGSLHRRGDFTGWWSERPVLCQLLADLIELEVHDIFAQGSTSSPLTFREFPALPALGREELPCRTSRGGSVFDLALVALRAGAQARSWITTPPGGGKSLAVELFRARFPDDVTACTVAKLRDAGVPVGDEKTRPIVIEVEEADPEYDEKALAALEAHPLAVVVLGSFKCPDDRNDAGSLLGSSQRRWRTIDGAPGPGWVERMLDWIAQRLETSTRDTKLDKDEALSWLRENAWVARTLRSPGELLALCADFDLYGGDGTESERATRWLGAVGTRSLPSDVPSTWRAQAAPNCMVAMVEADALDRGFALNQRSFGRWADVVPERVRPGAIADAPGADMAVAYLRAGGLLRFAEDGAVGFPSWVASAIAQNSVRRLVKQKAVSTWGPLAGDASRRRLVDDTLDSLSLRDLRSLGEQLVATVPAPSDARSFAEVAAIEATTAAFARRFASGDAGDREAGVAQQLLILQLQHLVNAPSIGEHRIPTTRRDRDEWFLTGWAISLGTSRTSRPKVDVPDDLRWVVPGWAVDLRLSDLQRFQFPWSAVGPWGASDAVRALAALAPQALERLAHQPVPLDVPRLLLPALFLSGAWTLELDHLTALAGSWEEVQLAAVLSSLAAERKRELATLLWGFASKACSVDTAAPVAERLVYLKHRHGPLLGVVLEHLPAEVVGATARDAGTHRRYGAGGSFTPSDPEVLRDLSSASRTAAVRGWLEMKHTRPVRFDEARELVQVLEGDDLDLVLDVVRTADRDVAAEFAARIWRVIPERALEEARAAFDQRLAAAEGWFHLAPRDQLRPLVEIVGVTGDPPAWVRNWALRRLLDAGPNADDLFNLARRAP